MGKQTRPWVLALVAALCLPAAFAAQRGAGATPASESAGPPSSTGAISGVVVDSGTGRTIANAVVTLTADCGAADRQLSDSRGRFVFTNLPPNGAYLLSATKPGYFDGRNGTPGARQSKRVALADGQWASDVRIEMLRPSSISGIVTDEHGEPIVSAVVRAIARLRVAGHEHLVTGPVARTDDRGVYRIGGLAAGSYMALVPSVQSAVPVGTPVYDRTSLAPMPRGAFTPDDPAVKAGDQLLFVGKFPTPPAAAPGEPALAYPNTFYPSARLIAEASAIDLGSSEDRTGIDIQLRPVPTWGVSGRVTGEAAAGALLRLVLPGTEDLGLGGEAATSLVMRDGTFSFPVVPAGRYALITQRSQFQFRYLNELGMAIIPTAPGFQAGAMGMGVVLSGPVGMQFTYANTPGAAGNWGYQEVSVDGRDVTSVELVIHPAIALSGRFEWEPTATIAQSRASARTVAFSAEPAAGRASLGMPSGTSSVADGIFSVEGLLPGAYLLRAFSASNSVKSITWNGKDYTYRAFDTTPGQDISDVVVTMTDRTPTVSGRVSSSGPDLGTAVILFPVEREQWTDYGMQPRRLKSVAAAPNGTYQVEVPAGRYYAIAVSGAQIDRWQDPKFLEAASGASATLEIGWGEKRTLDLKVSEVR